MAVTPYFYLRFDRKWWGLSATLYSPCSMAAGCRLAMVA